MLYRMDILLVKVYGYKVTSLSKLLRSTVGISILIKYIDRGWLHRILLPIHSVLHAAEQRRIRMSSITLSLRGARARKKMVSDSLDSWPRRLQSSTFIKAEGNERDRHLLSKAREQHIQISHPTLYVVSPWWNRLGSLLFVPWRTGLALKKPHTGLDEWSEYATLLL